MSVQHDVQPAQAPAQAEQPQLAPADAQPPGLTATELRVVEQSAAAPTGASVLAEEHDAATTPLVVRRRASVHAVVAGCAAALSLAYVTRARMPEGAALLWAVAAVLAAVALWHLWLVVDARSPLLVADRTGVRVRTRRGWQGLRWPDIDSTYVAPRRGLRDGAVSIRAVGAEDGTSPSTLRVPVGFATAVPAELSTALQRLAQLPSREPVPEPSSDPELESAAAPPTNEADREEQRTPQEFPDLTLRTAARAEVTNPPTARAPLDDGATATTADARRSPAQIGLLRRSGPGNVSVLVPTQDPAAQPPLQTEFTATPTQLRSTAAATAVPVIGPQIKLARERLGVSVDDLANRTRIRSHVIEALEGDDFEPCGGDFYARGHIRALSRVVGIDAEPLVRTYDERYAAGPISPRTVFQADFASGSSGALRRGGGGPHWGALVATVLVLALVWGVARIVFGA
jgi:hypothetical protein